MDLEPMPYNENLGYHDLLFIANIMQEDPHERCPAAAGSMRLANQMIVDLTAELADAKDQANRDYQSWIKQHRLNYERIGKALAPLRSYRASGEPSESDAREIELLAAGYRHLANQVETLTADLRAANEQAEKAYSLGLCDACQLASKMFAKDHPEPPPSKTQPPSIQKVKKW